MMVNYKGLFIGKLLLSSSILMGVAGCAQPKIPPFVSATPIETQVASPKLKQVLQAAMEQTKYTRSYDPAYVAIAYPGGDVPRESGVCTDVVIRAFRAIGVDLQQDVHEDMKRNFAAYPQYWGLSGPDPNIDRRRVPNLMKYFERQGKAIAITKRKEDYLPGDVVTWNLGDGQEHIGIVSHYKSAQTGQFSVVHNIGAGTRLEDVLLNWPIIGHYRGIGET
ncbi:DUF1287 domain-containing protein [Altericista sp. CCNU0014]|uniref:DUF1287 domain-containing protein n=1 Tax=Altericista sp. CCNU0014 TaxID=3082949 RepID=UPI0038501CE4